MWMAVHLIGATAIISIVQRTWINHITNPFVTTLHDTAYPISEIGFPGLKLTII